MKLLLVRDGLWNVVNQDKATATTVHPAPGANDATGIAAADTATLKAVTEWAKKDESAQVLIGLTVEDSQLRFIKDKKTAHEQWMALKSYHQKNTTSNKVHILKRIIRTTLEEGVDMEAHIATLSDYFDKLNALGVNMTDDVIACVYLSSLPESYDTLTTALESRPETDLTSEFVKSRLIDAFMRRKGVQEVRESSDRETAMKAEHKANSNGNPKRSCFFCKKEGHIKVNCNKYKAWKAKQEKGNKVSEESEKKGSAYTCREICLGARTTECSWIVDSGATSHMVQSREFFDKIDPSKKGFVCLADEKKAAIEGKGSGAIKWSTGGEKFSQLEISDVLFVPGLGTNLLSVRKMTNDGYELTFKEDSCSIIKNGKVKAVARAPSNSDLYEIKTAQRACTANQVVKEKASEGHTESCQHVWHRRLGHRHPDAIKELAAKGPATGIQVVDCGKREICEYCFKSKMPRLAFPKQSFSKTKAPLDLIHTDVCSMPELTVGRKKYALTIIDDFSRYSHLYLLEHKNEAPKFIKQFVQIGKTQFNKTVKMIRSDRGREYVNNDLRGYLQKEGIRIQYTAPYSPPQIGVAERKNRYLTDATRCMLSDAQLDKKYWGEAIHTACYKTDCLCERQAKHHMNYGMAPNQT